MLFCKTPRHVLVRKPGTFLNKTDTVHVYICLAGSQCCESGSGTFRAVQIRIRNNLSGSGQESEAGSGLLKLSVQFI